MTSGGREVPACMTKIVEGCMMKRHDREWGRTSPKISQQTIRIVRTDIDLVLSCCLDLETRLGLDLDQ